jgi:hypothetical protein
MKNTCHTSKGWSFHNDFPYVMYDWNGRVKPFSPTLLFFIPKLIKCECDCPTTLFKSLENNGRSDLFWEIFLCIITIICLCLQLCKCLVLGGYIRIDWWLNLLCQILKTLLTSTGITLYNWYHNIYIFLLMDHTNLFIFSSHVPIRIKKSLLSLSNHQIPLF